MSTWGTICFIIKLYFAIKKDCKERYKRDFALRWYEALESLTMEEV